MQPQEWYGEIKGDIGRLEGSLAALASNVSRLEARLDKHITHHSGENPGNSGNPGNGGRVKQLAGASGRYGGAAALVYMAIELLRAWTGI